MLRISSLLMMVLLAVPMVRECCLPIAQVASCHQSKQTDDSACGTNQGAITEAKSAGGVTWHIEHLPFNVGTDDVRRFAGSQSWIGVPGAAWCESSSEIYLRTGALLI